MRGGISRTKCPEAHLLTCRKRARPKARPAEPLLNVRTRRQRRSRPADVCAPRVPHLCKEDLLHAQLVDRECKQPEMVMMRTAAARRTRPAISRSSEIVEPLLEPFSGRVARSPLEAARTVRPECRKPPSDAKCRPEHPDRRTEGQSCGYRREHRPNQAVAIRPRLCTCIASALRRCPQTRRISSASSSPWAVGCERIMYPVASSRN